VTYLQRCALASLALDYDAVDKLHELARKQTRVESCNLLKVCVSHERLRAELEGEQLMHAETRAEAANVLVMLDELAELWGDEGKFRACRDRLRKMLGGMPG
jgi:hypothetical protein